LLPLQALREFSRRGGERLSATLAQQFLAVQPKLLRCLMRISAMWAGPGRNGERILAAFCHKGIVARRCEKPESRAEKRGSGPLLFYIRDMAKRKQTPPNNRVLVSVYRMSDEDVADLKDWLAEHDGIEGFSRVAFKSKDLVEEAINIGVTVAPFLAQYAGAKVLDFVLDLVKDWYKHRRKRSGFITLHLNSKRKKVGKGTPRRQRS
jgi:hypothetical protein